MGDINRVQKQPDFLETVGVINGGVMAKLAAKLMAEVAMAVCKCGDGKRKGKFSLTFDIAAGKGDGIVEVKHTLAFKHPTVKGSRSEDTADEQILYINRYGALTAVPDTEGEFEFSPDLENT